MSRKLWYESRSIVSAPIVATTETPTRSARCGSSGARFWIETAAEYAFANASSVSSTVTASSASTAPTPPAATATGSAAGSVTSREKKRTAPSSQSHVPARKYPTAAPQKALLRLRAKRV